MTMEKKLYSDEITFRSDSYTLINIKYCTIIAVANQLRMKLQIPIIYGGSYKIKVNKRLKY